MLTSAEPGRAQNGRPRCFALVHEADLNLVVPLLMVVLNVPVRGLIGGEILRCLLADDIHNWLKFILSLENAA